MTLNEIENLGKKAEELTKSAQSFKDGVTTSDGVTMDVAHKSLLDEKENFINALRDIDGLSIPDDEKSRLKSKFVAAIEQQEELNEKLGYSLEIEETRQEDLLPELEEEELVRVPVRVSPTQAPTQAPTSTPYEEQDNGGYEEGEEEEELLRSYEQGVAPDGYVLDDYMPLTNSQGEPLRVNRSQLDQELRLDYPDFGIDLTIGTDNLTELTKDSAPVFTSDTGVQVALVTMSRSQYEALKNNQTSIQEILEINNTQLQKVEEGYNKDFSVAIPQQFDRQISSSDSEEDLSEDLVSPENAQETVDFLAEKYEQISNVLEAQFPDASDAEIDDKAAQQFEDFLVEQCEPAELNYLLENTKLFSEIHQDNSNDVGQAEFFIERINNAIVIQQEQEQEQEQEQARGIATEIDPSEQLATDQVAPSVAAEMQEENVQQRGVSESPFIATSGPSRDRNAENEVAEEVEVGIDLETASVVSGQQEEQEEELSRELGEEQEVTFSEGTPHSEKDLFDDTPKNVQETIDFLAKNYVEIFIGLEAQFPDDSEAEIEVKAAQQFEDFLVGECEPAKLDDLLENAKLFSEIHQDNSNYVRKTEFLIERINNAIVKQQEQARGIASEIDPSEQLATDQVAPSVAAEMQEENVQQRGVSESPFIATSGPSRDRNAENEVAEEVEVGIDLETASVVSGQQEEQEEELSRELGEEQEFTFPEGTPQVFKDFCKASKEASSRVRGENPEFDALQLLSAAKADLVNKYANENHENDLDHFLKELEDFKAREEVKNNPSLKVMIGYQELVLISAKHQKEFQHELLRPVVLPEAHELESYGESKEEVDSTIASEQEVPVSVDKAIAIEGGEVSETKKEVKDIEETIVQVSAMAAVATELSDSKKESKEVDSTIVLEQEVSVSREPVANSLLGDTPSDTLALLQSHYLDHVKNLSSVYPDISQDALIEFAFDDLDQDLLKHDPESVKMILDHITQFKESAQKSIESGNDDKDNALLLEEVTTFEKVLIDVQEKQQQQQQQQDVEVSRDLDYSASLADVSDVASELSEGDRALERHLSDISTEITSDPDLEADFQDLQSKQSHTDVVESQIFDNARQERPVEIAMSEGSDISDISELDDFLKEQDAKKDMAVSAPEVTTPDVSVSTSEFSRDTDVVTKQKASEPVISPELEVASNIYNRISAEISSRDVTLDETQIEPLALQKFKEDLSRYDLKSLESLLVDAQVYKESVSDNPSVVKGADFYISTLEDIITDKRQEQSVALEATKSEQVATSVFGKAVSQQKEKDATAKTIPLTGTAAAYRQFDTPNARRRSAVAKLPATNTPSKVAATYRQFDTPNARNRRRAAKIAQSSSVPRTAFTLGAFGTPLAKRRAASKTSVKSSSGVKRENSLGRAKSM